MQLHAAAARGDANGIALALKSGADVNARNVLGQTALVFALDLARAFANRHGPTITVDALKFLLNAGADLEALDNLGCTAIHHAVRIRNPAFLEVIIERGGNPTHVTTSNYSVLTHACYQPSSAEKRAIVRRLHEAGASLDTASDYGESPLSVCLYFGDLETMRFLLDLGADPKPLNWSPLHGAVAFGNLSDIERLRPSVTEINTPNDRFQLSPWLLSFIRGDLAIIRSLAERGGDLTQIGKCGDSLLHLAARFGHLKVTEWLNELGADPNALNQHGDSPLHQASEWDHVPCAAALIGFGANAVEHEAIHPAKSLGMIQTLVELGGANINDINGCGEWPLKTAAEANDVKRTEWLLKHGAEVNRTSTGETALHAAVLRDSRECIDILLRAGANPNQRDVDGWTPLFSAQSVETIHTLRNAGADLRIEDQIGSGPEEWRRDPILVKSLHEGVLNSRA